MQSFILEKIDILLMLNINLEESKIRRGSNPSDLNHQDKKTPSHPSQCDLPITISLEKRVFPGRILVKLLFTVTPNLCDKCDKIINHCES